MSIIKAQGIVIKETNVGEADKIITLFTRNKGKIQASARGARRNRSSLIAGTQFLCFSDFVLYKGKTMYRVSQSEVIESFFNIRNSIEKLSYATYFIELVSEVIDEDHANPKLLKLILNTLHMLSNTQKDARLLKVVYELRLMSIIGFSPNMHGCTQCGNNNNETTHFNSSIGGLICSECMTDIQSRNNIAISNGTLQTMRYILYSDMKKIFSFEASEKVLKELEIVILDFILTHIGKEFKSLKFLDNILSDS